MKLIFLSVEFLKKNFYESRLKVFKSTFYQTLTVLSFILIPDYFVCQVQDSVLSSDKLKKMSLEELMNVQITSVSKRPEKLSEVASAVQVITQEDIKRSGATNIPEALRLCPNLQVAQIRANAWIISARGFNAAFSNKLLVMIDGRTVYSPLFAGVFWDIQSVLLEDVERIEVISGPGGTLWGANAVNGVINIITKSAKDTKGLYVSAAAGTFLQNYEAIRYSGKIGSRFSYRVFGQHSAYDNTVLKNKKANSDSAALSQAGFRLDWNPTDADNLSVIGNLYTAEEKTEPKISPNDGQNILGKWTRTFSERSELIVQAYFDRTWRRDIPSTITDELKTYDLDFQHRFSIGKRNTILWGGGYRLMQDETKNSTIIVGILPNNKTMELYSGFVQDEISLVPDKFKLTIGTKLLHNVFSGFEYQPSARLAFTPNEKHTIWTAVSRAIRAPSRIDVDYYLPTYPVPPNAVSIAGGPNFTSEKVIAYELGYRIHPFSKLSLSLAGFYNQYDDLYSVEALPGTLTYEIQNGGRGYSYGAELSGNYQLFDKWRLRGGYTYFFKKLENKPGHHADYSSLGIDPSNQFLLQSIIDLPLHFQFDVVARYVDSLSATVSTVRIPGYFTFDTRIAWQYKKIEISFTGKNLATEYHPEIGTAYIPRNYYLKITCRL